ncbi:MAG: glucose-6-phosphate isomerase [Magnetococcales bacterium]|nr:glucose-6-phosphate isomerase [Magnetococcales bacterium]
MNIPVPRLTVTIASNTNMDDTRTVNTAPLHLQTHNFLQHAIPCPTHLLESLALWQRSPSDRPAFLQLIPGDQEINQSLHWAERFRQRADHLVVLGIGGSSLGGNMLVRTLTRNASKVSFFENICPEQLTSLYEMEWRHTQILAISKSGETPETLAQLLTLLPVVQERPGPGLPEQIAIVTENPHSALGRIATSLHLPIIPHAPVGGRFSVLSVTGLLPAAFAGVEIPALLAGATRMAQRCLQPDPDANPALRCALAQTGLAAQGRNMSVMLSYGSRLETIATWFRQLWAESLGKIDPRGQKQGLTPVEARGVVDQHSQLQLYLDGPEDKQFTLLFDPTLTGLGRTIPAGSFAALPAVAPLAGRSVGELFTAEYLGTRDALLNRNAPLREFRLSANNPGALGELILQLEMETTLVAGCLGVTPFDQPAVEDGKKRARARLESSAPGTLS